MVRWKISSRFVIGYISVLPLPSWFNSIVDFAVKEEREQFTFYIVNCSLPFIFSVAWIISRRDSRRFFSLYPPKLCVTWSWNFIVRYSIRYYYSYALSTRVYINFDESLLSFFLRRILYIKFQNVLWSTNLKEYILLFKKKSCINFWRNHEFMEIILLRRFLYFYQGGFHGKGKYPYRDTWVGQDVSSIFFNIYYISRLDINVCSSRNNIVKQISASIHVSNANYTANTLIQRCLHRCLQFDIQTFRNKILILI